MGRPVVGGRRNESYGVRGTMKKGRKTKLLIANPRYVFDHATRFWITDKEVICGKDLPQKYLPFIGPPSMVICSFAIELFLKCILLIEGQEVPNTHDLAKLFRRISHKRKRRIDELWEAHGRPRA